MPTPKVWTLPSIALRDLALLPAIPAVYYVNADGNIVYIGYSKNIRERWNGNFGHGDHHKLRSLKKYRNVRIYYWKRPEWRIRHDEAAEIKRFRPKLNDRYEVTVWWISAIDWLDHGFQWAIVFLAAYCAWRLAG